MQSVDDIFLTADNVDETVRELNTAMPVAVTSEQVVAVLARTPDGKTIVRVLAAICFFASKQPEIADAVLNWYLKDFPHVQGTIGDIELGQIALTTFANHIKTMMPEHKSLQIEWPEAMACVVNKIKDSKARMGWFCQFAYAVRSWPCDLRFLELEAAAKLFDLVQADLPTELLPEELAVLTERFQMEGPGPSRGVAGYGRFKARQARAEALTVFTRILEPMMTKEEAQAALRQFTQQTETDDDGPEAKRRC